MPRFVLLRHQCPPGYEKPSHWDFMLESGGVLRTWELPELPSAWAALLGVAPGNDSEVDSEVASENDTVRALPLPDHRLAYLEFEGPLSGDRGDVHRCDSGTYELLKETQERITLRLDGRQLRGAIRLTRQGEGWDLALREP